MAEKFTIKFVNPDTKEYLEQLVPLTWTNNDTAAYCSNFETDSVTFEKLEKDLLNVIEKIMTESDIYPIIYIFDDLNTDIYAIHIKKTSSVLSISGYRNTEATISADMTDVIDFVIQNLNNEIMDIYLRAKATKVKKISGTSVTHSEDNEENDLDMLVEKINKETKAEIVKPKETLADYQCNNILKEELEEIKDFFEHRNTYKTSGIELPKGILFKGPPGTGKTYAARCIAGSVDCYFMICTASSLQGMYIGSGAENIRNVFKGAKMLANKSKKGVIVFIDEFDSFGSRGNDHGASGESDRTINQLLAEISNVDENDDIMVLAATNYPDKLDEALQRSGRFGRQITIEYPDDFEREAIIKQYFSKLSLPLEGCTFSDITALTKGMTPADIKEIANESGILTIRQKLSKISLDNINEAVNKVITKDTRHPDDSKILDLVTAHESGHVLAEVIYNGTIPIKVTNYAYGSAGGFTQQSEHLTGLITGERYLNEIKILLAGRAAEEVIYNKITNGASNDLEKAKALLKSYYERYNFKHYKADEIKQIILDDLDNLYRKVVEDFSKNDNYKILLDLINALNSKRVLYSNDILTLTTSLLKTI